MLAKPWPLRVLLERAIDHAASTLLTSALLLIPQLGCGDSGDISVGGNRLLPPASVLARPADAFVGQLGVNTHFGYPESLYATQRDAIVLPALAELGVRHVRENVTSRIASDFPPGELSALLVFRGAPIDEAVAWAKTLGNRLSAVEGPSDTDYAQDQFSYGGERFPQGTAAYQRALFEAVQSDPSLSDVPVVFPTVYTASNAVLLGALGSGTHCNVHARRLLGETPSDDADLLLREAPVICGDVVPTFATSVSYSTLESAEGGVSELVAAKYLLRSALEYFKRGVDRFYVYELIDERPDPDGLTLDLHRGLLRADGSRKPAFNALANLNDLLSDPGPVFEPAGLAYGLTGQSDAVHQLLLQSRNGDFHLLLWQEVPSWNAATMQPLPVPEVSVELAFERSVRAVNVFRPLEGAAPFASLAAVSRLLVDVPDHPIVIRIAR